MCVLALQELAGYTGGDASFLKEDLELQLNRRLFWDSVSDSKPVLIEFTSINNLNGVMFALRQCINRPRGHVM